MHPGKQMKLMETPFSGRFVVLLGKKSWRNTCLTIVQWFAGGFVGDWPFTGGDAVASGTTSNPGSM